MLISSVLFAAGRGTRLRPLTDAIPKPALPILDLPLGAFGLTRIVAAAPPVIVNVRHLGQAVTTALAPWGAFEVLAEEPEAFGTAGTLGALRPRLGPQVVTYNSDVVADLDVDAFLRAHRAGGAPGIVAVARVPAGADFEGADGVATRLIPRWTEPAAAGFRFLGVAVFEASALHRLTDRRVGRAAGLAEGLLAPLVEHGELALWEHSGYARDVSDPNSYIGVSSDALAGRAPGPLGGTWPGEIVEVPGGLAYVGLDAVVEGELGPDAIVLAGAKLAAGARITRSIVMPGVTVPDGADIRDKIVS